MFCYYLQPSARIEGHFLHFCSYCNEIQIHSKTKHMFIKVSHISRIPFDHTLSVKEAIISSENLTNINSFFSPVLKLKLDLSSSPYN